MKAIITIILLFNLHNTYSQTDSKTDRDKSSDEVKPSWSTSMPTRESSPNLKFNAELDEEDELDRGDLGFDRDSFLEPDDTETNSRASLQLENPIVTSPEELKKIDEEEKIAAEKLLEQQRIAEEKKIAEQQLAEQQTIDEEKRIAEDTLREQQRLIEEKRIADEIAKESLKESAKFDEPVDNAIETEKQDQLDDVVKAPVQLPQYRWKKLKNALPEYPTKAARSRKEGWVEVEITIDISGSVVNAVAVKFSNNNRIFNKSALRAVKQWKFEAPSNYGINIELSKVVRIVFKL